MKKILIILTLMTIIPIAQAIEIQGDEYQIYNTFTTGGVNNINLTGTNVSYGMSQYFVGNYTGTQYNPVLGIYYILQVQKIDVLEGIASFVFYLKERGIEYIRLYW